MFLKSVIPWNLKFTSYELHIIMTKPTGYMQKPTRKAKAPLLPCGLDQQWVSCLFSLSSAKHWGEPDQFSLDSASWGGFYFNWNSIILSPIWASFLSHHPLPCFGYFPQTLLCPNYLFLCDYFTLKFHDSFPQQLPWSFTVCVLVTITILLWKAEIVLHFILAFLKLQSTGY